MTRRWKHLTISKELMYEIIIDALSEVREMGIVVENALPQDVKVVTVHKDFLGDTYKFTLEHPSFPEVEYHDTPEIEHPVVARNSL